MRALRHDARIETLQQAHALRAAAAGRFHSATHEEIASGATGDVYFVKTMEILRHLGLASTPVTAEVFAGR
ncbi:MAG TPA: nicotinate phosphoribosyltransferase, partial [Bacillota bacterium]